MLNPEAKDDIPIPTHTDAFFMMKRFKKKMLWCNNRVHSLNTDQYLKKYSEKIADYGFYFGGFSEDELHHIVICVYCEMQIQLQPSDKDFDPRSVEELHKERQSLVCPFLRNSAIDVPRSLCAKELGFQKPDYSSRYPLTAFAGKGDLEDNPNQRCHSCAKATVCIVFSPCRCSYLCGFCASLKNDIKCDVCDKEIYAYSMVYIS